MTWSPATDGVNVGLALPRSTSAIRLARRPSTCPLASTRYHLAALAAPVVVAMNVRIALLRAVAGGAMSGPRPRSPLQAPYCTARGDRVSICGSDRVVYSALCKRQGSHERGRIPNPKPSATPVKGGIRPWPVYDH